MTKGNFTISCNNIFSGFKSVTKGKVMS